MLVAWSTVTPSSAFSWAAQGDTRLRTRRVAVVGLGATGSVIATWLARAGVGHLTLIDRDLVELSNLQRQILYGEADLYRAKAESGGPAPQGGQLPDRAAPGGDRPDQRQRPAELQAGST